MTFFCARLNNRIERYDVDAPKESKEYDIYKQSPMREYDVALRVMISANESSVVEKSILTHAYLEANTWLIQVYAKQC